MLSCFIHNCAKIPFFWYRVVRSDMVHCGTLYAIDTKTILQKLDLKICYSRYMCSAILSLVVGWQFPLPYDDST